jgi:hypothetical protein
MEHAELSALADLGLAASNLRTIAEGMVCDPESIRTAEAILFVARGLMRSQAELRDLVVAHTSRRPPAPVVPLRPVSPMEGSEHHA